jgi:hypothetical protein
MVKGKKLKIIALRSPLMAWLRYWISQKCTSSFKSLWGKTQTGGWSHKPAFPFKKESGLKWAVHSKLREQICKISVWA